MNIRITAYKEVSKYNHKINKLQTNKRNEIDILVLIGAYNLHIANMIL